MANLAPPPTTRTKLMEEAGSLAKLAKLAKLNQKLTPRQSLLHAIYESYSRKRAIGSMSILILGSSGVGKSSAVNFLFDLKECDVNAAKTSNCTSETRCVSELTIQTTEDQYETRDIKVAIVDSPSLNDTHGLAQDACNALAIKKFYEDCALKADAGKIYPNLIFVVVTIYAHEKLFNGPLSLDVDSMRVLGTLDLVDTAKPNVVGIIIFSPLFATSKTKWIEGFENMKKRLQWSILKHLHVEAPVVALKNYPEKEKLEPEGYGYLLPDGVTQQPRNLFTACSNLLWENGDLFGHLAFTSAFKGSHSGPLPGRVLPAKIANTTPADDTELQLSRLIQRTRDEKMSKLKGDRAFCLTKDFIVEHTKISSNDKGRIYNLPFKLKENGIEDLKELFELSTCGISLTTETWNTPAVEKFLVRFGAKQTNPVTLENSAVLIGHGFNFLTDNATAPIISLCDLKNTKMGIIVPALSMFDPINQTVTFMHNVEDEVELMKTRQRHLNVSLEVDQLLLNGFKARAGFSLNKQHEAAQSNTEYSFLLEQRMFTVSIPSLDTVRLENDFKRAVQKLPHHFKRLDANNRSKFIKFFDKWGHFVVTQAFGGGSFEVKISGSSSSNIDFESIKLKLMDSFNEVFMSPTASAGYKPLSSELTAFLGICRIEWNGGDSQFHRHATLTDPQLMNKWRFSLADNPAMLTTDLTLAPISEPVQKVDDTRGKECYMALEYLFGEKFSLRKKQEDRLQLELNRPKTRKQEVAEDREGKNSLKFLD